MVMDDVDNSHLRESRFEDIDEELELLQKAQTNSF